MITFSHVCLSVYVCVFFLPSAWLIVCLFLFAYFCLSLSRAHLTAGNNEPHNWVQCGNTNYFGGNLHTNTSCSPPACCVVVVVVKRKTNVYIFYCVSVCSGSSGYPINDFFSVFFLWHTLSSVAYTCKF